MNKKSLMVFGLALAVMLFVGGCTTAQSETDTSSGEVVTIFKEPSCGCCVGHANEYEREGYSVNLIESADLDTIKRERGISVQMASCHTAVIGEYFVEGHVPIEAVEKLLREKPDIDGIALPGMPAGSPGMPGVKQGTWTIYAIKDGVASKYMEI